MSPVCQPQTGTQCLTLHANPECFAEWLLGRSFSGVSLIALNQIYIGAIATI
jgi:hypothetical protein